MYLIYYRAARCHTNINWSILDGINQEITIQPDMPTETDAVFRTLMFAMVYLILSIFLVITSILSLSESFADNKRAVVLIWLVFFLTHSWTQANGQIEAPHFLAVLRAVHHRFRISHNHGLDCFGILPFRVLLTVGRQRADSNFGNQKSQRDTADSGADFALNEELAVDDPVRGDIEMHFPSGFKYFHRL